MITFIQYVTQSINPDQKYANKHWNCKDPVQNHPLRPSCLKQRQVSITCHFPPTFLSLQTLRRFLHTLQLFIQWSSSMHFIFFSFNFLLLLFCMQREVGVCYLIKLKYFSNPFVVIILRINSRCNQEASLVCGLRRWLYVNKKYYFYIQLDILNYEFRRNSSTQLYTWRY